MSAKTPDVASLRILTPLPRQMWTSNCSLCDKPQARWTVRAVSAPVFLCSMCLMYESAWGKRNAIEVLTLKTEMERHREPFAMQDGKLQHCADADSILGVMVLVERTVARMPRE